MLWKCLSSVNFLLTHSKGSFSFGLFVFERLPWSHNYAVADTQKFLIGISTMLHVRRLGYTYTLDYTFEKQEMKM